jgi:hypothetical protein
MTHSRHGEFVEDACRLQPIANDTMRLRTGSRRNSSHFAPVFTRRCKKVTKENFLLRFRIKDHIQENIAL